MTDFNRDERKKSNFEFLNYKWENIKKNFGFVLVLVFAKQKLIWAKITFVQMLVR